jgi:hypothetical protein
VNARVPPPLVGFNNNVRYRGTSFHIQTEDSGVARPHVITHLFIDGGHIIKTLRTDYSEHVSSPDCRAVVQRMMREQHRAMAHELRKGQLDSILDQLLQIPAPSHSKGTVSSRPSRPPPEHKAEPNPGRVDPDGTEAKPKRRRTPRSRTAVRAEQGSRTASARNMGGPSPSSPDAHFEPEGATIFGPPRESLDELILGYIAQTIE